MKRAAPLVLAGLAAVSAAQQLFTYRDRAGSLSVQAKSGLVEQRANNRLHLELKGSPVVLKSSTDGLTMRAQSIVCDAVSASKTTVQKAVATGGLTANKTGGGSTTDITASAGTFTPGQLSLQGAVKIVSRSAGRTTTITGRNGTATLGQGNSGGLRRATLTGPVRIEAVQAGNAGSTVIATGSRLDADNVAHVVTLSGNVNVTGNGTGTFGELHGADRATLVLNAKGEVSSVRVSQGASQ